MSRAGVPAGLRQFDSAAGLSGGLFVFVSQLKSTAPYSTVCAAAMGLFSEHFRERVRSSSDIVEIIGAALPLKRSGASFVALCPFHKEKSPSFHVNPHKQIFYCFGCHKGGDVFRFIQDYENLSFPEAVERLAERARIPVEYVDGSSSSNQDRTHKDLFFKLHEGICLRWQNCLANEAAGQTARDYLASRGVSPDAIKEFRIGAAPKEWDDTVNWARSKGFDLARVSEAGLIVPRDNGGHYDRFRGRLMFPICDEQGRVIAFSGRVLPGDDSPAKYVNSPETPLFVKSKVLFGLDKAKRAILDAGHAVLCEGQLDTIACHAAGVRNAVAPQGTAFTADQARILRRYTEEVVLCFDGDRAGQDASIRVLEDILRAGLTLRVASIPPPDDPDSFIRQKGVDAFRDLLKRAQGFFDFYLRILASRNDLTSDRGRLQVVRSIGQALQKAGSPVLFDTYAQKTAQLLGISADAVRNEFRRLPDKPQSPQAESSGQPQPSNAAAETGPPPSLGELWLVRLILASDDLREFGSAHLELGWVAHPTIRRIVQTRLEMQLEASQLISHFELDSLAQRIIAEACSEKRPIPNPEQQLADVIKKLRDQQIDRRIAALGSQLQRSDIDDSARMEIVREQQELRQAKRMPLQPIAEA